MAEKERFELSGLASGRSPSVCLRPLGHLSAIRMKNGADVRNRTGNLLITSQLLRLIELRRRKMARMAGFEPATVRVVV